MYENRETSELFARRSGADGPEKAASRKTGVNGAEESDCAVVPMNEAYKGEPKEGLNAEAGEGRAWTKESISQAIRTRHGE
jgi:RNA-directed DNA polymerase